VPLDRDARRAQLAEAVWRVVRERGISAVSVRTVAEEAGVVVGSLRHVFPTRAELVAFSARLMVVRATERILATPRTGDALLDAVAVLRHLLPLEPDSRAELEVNIALIAEAPALPALRDIRDEAHRELAELCVLLCESVAHRERDPALLDDARRLHALADGLAVHLLLREGDGGWAVEMLRAELERLRG
jgi:AcrR family transcriptional regulator